MCERVVEKYPYNLKFVPDYFKTQDMCDNAVRRRSLEYIRDWFMKQQHIGVWVDGDDGIIKWCDGYKKRKAQKVQIKKELMRVAWHSSRWWNWCVPEDEKKKQKNYGHKHETFFVSDDWIQKTF